MEPISLPAEQVVPLDAVAPGVRGLRIAFVNVFGVEHGGGQWTLIDAAIPWSAGHIRRWAEEQYGGAPASIVLTHGHFDHVSAAAELAEEWDVPIYAHRLEFPYLSGEKEYPAPNVGAGGGLMTLLSPLYPRKPVDLGRRLRELTAGSEVMAGWEVVPTPGHTPGHVSFFRQRDRTLVVGDAFCTTKPESFFEAALAQQAELHGPPAYFTSDWAAARASVEKLAALGPETVAPGHGKALSGPDVAGALREMALKFAEIAVPENQRAG